MPSSAVATFARVDGSPAMGRLKPSLKSFASSEPHYTDSSYLTGYRRYSGDFAVNWNS
jgi:hypothetical protein